MTMLRSDSGGRANNHLVPGSRRGRDIASNSSPPGSTGRRPSTRSTLNVARPTEQHHSLFIASRPLVLFAPYDVEYAGTQSPEALARSDAMGQEAGGDPNIPMVILHGRDNTLVAPDGNPMVR